MAPYDHQVALKDWLEAGGGGGGGGTQEGRKGLLFPGGPGPGLQDPVLLPIFLGQLLASFSSQAPCIRVTRARGSRTQVQENHQLFGKSLGLFWPWAAFSLFFSSLSSVFLKPQGWAPDTHSTDLIPQWGAGHTCPRGHEMDPLGSFCSFVLLGRQLPRIVLPSAPPATSPGVPHSPALCLIL